MFLGFNAGFKPLLLLISPCFSLFYPGFTSGFPLFYPIFQGITVRKSQTGWEEGLNPGLDRRLIPRVGWEAYTQGGRRAYTQGGRRRVPTMVGR